MGGHDVGSTRYANVDAPVADLRATTRVSVGGYPGVAVVDDVVYVGGRSLSARRRDGTVKWEHGETNDWRVPAVVDGTVYSTTEERVHALDAADGEREWSFRTGTRFTVVLPTAEAVYLVATDYLPRQSDEDGTVYALNPADGSVRWKRSVPKLWTTSVADGSVYASSGENRVYGLDATSGERRWVRDVDGRPSALHADAGRVYVSQDGRLTALDANSGGKQWRYVAPSDGYCSLAVAPDAVYLVRQAAELTVFDPRTGVERWSTRRTDGMPMAVTDDALYLRDRRSLNVVSTEDASMLGRFVADARIHLAAVTDDDLFVTDVEGNLYRVVEQGRETTTAAGGDAGGSAAATVGVGPDGELVFAPETVTVPAGTTVQWVWYSNGHGIAVDSQPDGADWRGTPGDEERTFDRGFRYAHTFAVPGTYEYRCPAHDVAGMTGTVVVTDSTSTTPGPSTTPATTVAGTSRPDGTTATTGSMSGGLADTSDAPEGTTDSGGQPGMGLLAGLAGVAGAGYLLGRSGDE